VHGVGIGTDMRTVPGLALAAGCALAGAAAVAWRWSVPRALPAEHRARAALGTLRRRHSAPAGRLVTGGRP
jgi:hypothetical protein